MAAASRQLALLLERGAGGSAAEAAALGNQPGKAESGGAASRGKREHTHAKNALSSALRCVILRCFKVNVVVVFGGGGGCRLTL